MSRIGRASVAALLVLLPGLGGADSGLAFLRLPLSARQQASGGPYGDYDILGVAENPATLANQPKTLELNAANQYIFGSSEVVLGLGAGWVGGAPDTGAWGLAAIANQVASAGFDEVDPSGNPTGNRVAPMARRFELAGSYQADELAGGLALGVASESYGSLGGSSGRGPSTILLDAGVNALFAGGRAGAAFQYRTAGVPSDVNAGGAVEVIGVWLSADALIPLGAEAGPSGQAGLRVPCSDAFDLQAAYAMSVATDVAVTLASSIRLGFSLRGPGLGLDYTLVIPTFSGVGVTNLIGLGWDFGDLRPAFHRPAPPWHGPEDDETPPAPAPPAP